ncbi:hypothetical protein CcI49_02980 [Frankia sp. CcI49]|uniref:hypothetical protein n=1 Tax=Frankia sp. CcI49 TaxID=1745382 RepID=UPI00097603C7|nr:hypothetical protein [Frankia sp. CcI49]ONH62359.1 hypothetical protein CcI49_02980 [Frankia sp. CcI49]
MTTTMLPAPEPEDADAARQRGVEDRGQRPSAPAAGTAGGAPLRVLSLGAGVQSTTLALLAAEGVLPKPDVAIFADTGWEPEAVYLHLARLEKVMASAGIPLLRVSHGNLRDDVLDPHVFATLPAYTSTKVISAVPVQSSAVPCEGCTGTGWADGVERYDDGFGFRITGAQWHADLKEQYGHLGALVLDDLPEPPAGLCLTCKGQGHRYTEFRTGSRIKKGRGPRQCTPKYKVEPIDRKVRELLGARVREVPCKYCSGSGVRLAPWDPNAGPGPCSVCRGRGERRLVGSAPERASAIQWIGFSTDEIHRVNNGRFPRYVTPEYPLLDLGMSREDCQAWLGERGWGETPKSACIGCPFHGNRMWRQMRDHDPESWKDAVAFDGEARTGRGLDGQRFLHASRVPLELAPIDPPLLTVEAASLAGGAQDLEDGDPDGCSPYGCRSGSAA